MEKMIQCKTCGEQIAKSASTCPKCGAKQKKHTVLKFFLALIVISMIASAIGGNKETNRNPQNTPQQNNSPAISSQEPAKSEEDQQPTVPREYLNALAQAQTYSDSMHMSRLGIFDQLTSEYGGKFPPEAAQYAIDNVDADYNKNALETAKVYYEQMNMSKEDIRDQLTSAYGSRFTHEEADYAIEHLD